MVRLQTPSMHLSAKSGNWVFPLKSPKVHPTSLLPLKSSMGWKGSIRGDGWIPKITVNPQPCHTNSSPKHQYNHQIKFVIIIKAIAQLYLI